MTKRTNIYFDFEFLDDGREIVPVSLGMCTNAIALADTAPSVVAGRMAAGDRVQCDFYQEYQFDPARANDWVRTNVFPHLDSQRCPGGIGTGERRFRITEWIKEWVADVCGDTTPRFIGYYPSYDFVCLCQHFGNMMQTPKGWPMRPECLMQMADELGVSAKDFPDEESGKEHHALADAKWNRELHRFLETAKGKLNGEG